MATPERPRHPASRLDVAGDFGGFDGRAWLNCAHQGPPPHRLAAP